MVAVSWIYNLKKTELVAELSKYQLDTAGNIGILRQRLVHYVRQNTSEFETKPIDPLGFDEAAAKLKDLYIEPSPTDTMQGSQPIERVVVVESATPAHIRTLETMRKWGCHFDGKDLYTFLERIDELQNAYQLTDEQLIIGLPELLRGDAQLWYRNLPRANLTWTSVQDNLRSYFLSPGEFRNLDRLISDRRQGAKESIRSFTLAVTTLMRRRGGYDLERQLDTLYYQMKAEYRLHIRRTELRSVNDIVQLAEELEETLRQINKETRDSKPIPKNPTMTLTQAYNRRDCCWRCKQRGHNRTDCTNKPIKFCSRCGKNDIFSRDCKCTKSGNAEGAGETPVRPKKNTDTTYRQE